MYYYKARIYSPTLGRFLQTDPIGYEDQFNLYAYVANDPVNFIDFTGENRGRVGRRPGIGHNGGPPILETVIPGYRRPAGAHQRLLTADGVRNANEEIANENRNAQLIGLGNFQGVSRLGEATGFDSASRLQRGLSFTQFEGVRGPQRFEFSGNEGVTANQVFGLINPDNVQQRDFKTGPGLSGTLSFGGGSTATVNLRQRTSTQSAGIDVHITTQRPGSRIKTRTTVKINFRDPEEQN